MAIRLEDRVFEGVRIAGAGHTYAGLQLVNTLMRGCTITQVDDPTFPLVIRDVLVENCTADRCRVQGAYFDDVVVDGLATRQVFQLLGCVFRKVVLKGKIGPIMFMAPNLALAHREATIAKMVVMYQDVEWALDISEARFADADFVGVPGHLVRYNAESQILLRREAFANVEVSSLPDVARIWVRGFKTTPFDSLIGVAPKDAQSFSRYMASIEWLHSNGLAG